jgi:ParB family chromosome partitioning protein
MKYPQAEVFDTTSALLGDASRCHTTGYKYPTYGGTETKYFQLEIFQIFHRFSSAFCIQWEKMDEQRRIPIEQIRRPRIALRPIKRKSPEYIELVESVKKDGILQPILVRPWDDEFEIVEGWHRYEAARESGLQSIPCMVRDMTNEEIEVLQIKCNAIRPKTATFEYARRLKKLMESGLTLSQLCAKIDKTQRWVREQLQLNRISNECRGPIERGEVPMTSALALANLPVDLQPKFLDDAIAMTPKEFGIRAKAALRDFKAFLMSEAQKNRDLGAPLPALRASSVVKREAIKPKEAKAILRKMQAKTPLDGWNAALAWVLKLDPVTIERKLDKKKESEDELMTNAEYIRTNTALIEKFVVPQSELGNHRHG